jgi:hypothetical protein
MLRISHDRVTSKEVGLVVEGSLQGPWVRELEKTCEPFVGNGRTLTLDLSQVLFADGGGVELLRQLRQRGAALQCSPFLAELLGGSREQGSAKTGQGRGESHSGTEGR